MAAGSHMNGFSLQASLSLPSHFSCSCHLGFFCPSNIPTHSHLQPSHWSFCLEHSQGDTWLSPSNAFTPCLNITSSSNPIRNSTLLSLDPPGHTYPIRFSPLPYHLLWYHVMTYIIFIFIVCVSPSPNLRSPGGCLALNKLLINISWICEFLGRNVAWIQISNSFVVQNLLKRNKTKHFQGLKLFENNPTHLFQSLNSLSEQACSNRTKYILPLVFLNFHLTWQFGGPLPWSWDNLNASRMAASRPHESSTEGERPWDLPRKWALYVEYVLGATRTAVNTEQKITIFEMTTNRTHYLSTNT